MIDERGSSFGALFGASLLPRTTLARVAVGLVALKATLSWVLARFVLDEPLAVTALYRPGGDIQYFELVRALAAGNFGESNVFERVGSGVQTFPFAPLVPHALALASLGPWGLLAADVIAHHCFFGAVVLTLRLARLPERVAVASSLGVAAYLPITISQITERLGVARFVMGGDRFPRPLIAETCLLAGAAIVMLLLEQREAPRLRAWVLGGVVLSLLLQADIYGAFIVLQALVVVLVARVVGSSRRERSRWLAGLLIGGLAFLVALVPFALQRLGSHPDLVRRFGLYSVSRVAASGWLDLLPLRVPLGVSLLAAALVVWRRRVSGDSPALLRVLGLWVGLVWIAFFAMTLFGVLVGQAIQMDHFADRFWRFASYAVAIVLFHVILFGAGRSVLRLGWKPERLVRLGTVLTFVAFVVFGGAILVRGITKARRTEHVRAEYFGFDRVAPYRPALAGLVRELERPEYREIVVLGTLDHQLHVYWQAFRGGRSFVPDLFVSTVTDGEAEQRLVAFCAAVGMSADEFVAFSDRPWFNTFWLGLAKYSTNREHLPFARSEYSRAELAASDERSVLSSWTTVIPKSEQARLRARFVNGASDWRRAGRLDAIVLTKDRELGRYQADPRFFRLTFENSLFELYVRR